MYAFTGQNTRTWLPLTIKRIEILHNCTSRRKVSDWMNNYSISAIDPHSGHQIFVDTYSFT